MGVLAATREKTTVESLLEQGYAYMPFHHRSLVLEAYHAYQEFFHSVEDPEIWGLIPPDETEIDEGLKVLEEGELRWNGAPADRKSYWHQKVGTRERLQSAGVLVTPEARALLSVGENLFGVCRDVALDLVAQLDVHFGGDTFKDAFHACEANPLPTCRNTLRLLNYPPRHVDEEFCAQSHIDRCFFSVHVHDDGGELYWADSKNGDPNGIVSPPEGSALVFFGKKGKQFLSQLPDPLWHGSIAQSGVLRRATVWFGHINIPMQHADA